MRRNLWTPGDEACLRDLYPHTPSAVLAQLFERPVKQVWSKANSMGLRKSAAFLALPISGRFRTGAPQGARTRFQPGRPPANKGLRRPGWAPGRMRETQFRAGERRGRAAAIYQPIGAERISKDGYLERKVNDDRPFQRRWRAVHRIVWELAHSPVPPGHAVVFRPGLHTHDAAEITPERLELVSRRELMLRNSRHANYPPELNELIQLKGALTRKINKRSKS